MTTLVLDENGRDAYYDDWLWGCGIENQHAVASNGERVTVALALQIAADVLRGLDPDTPELIIWTPNDMKLARAAIAGLRGQGGCEHLDPAVRDGMLTHFCDIAIYG